MTSTRLEPASTYSLTAAHKALVRGAWEEACGYFKLALEAEETPEALEGLGMAAWWLEDATTVFDIRERAYQLYRECGDGLGAARMATALAWDYNDYRDEPAIANGWLQRARRLLEGCNLSAEHAWMTLREAEIALLFHNDTTTALRLSTQGAAAGRSLGVIDLEMVGLSLEGLALVRKGEVTKGICSLDEGMAATIAGELTDLYAIGVICRNLIYACEWARDYGRAAQWCDRMKEFCKCWPIRSLFAIWRIEYAAALIWRGAWAEAEVELTTAIDELTTAHNGKMVEAVVRLAELRRRQGRLEEAARLFVQTEFHSSALLGYAELALDQGDLTAAADRVERFLRRIPPEHWTERTAGLELLVRVQIAFGEYDQASATLAELQSFVTQIATEPLRALACFAEGLLTEVTGNYERVRCLFEDAVESFERSGARFETAKARIHLARCLYALNRCNAAEKEIRAALDSLLRMGAAYLAKEAASLLAELENNTHVPICKESCIVGLTGREQEVLRLVAQGLTNHLIACRLTLSDHTVHRHIANILTKLHLPSRAAAAVYAAQHKLL